MMSEVHTCSYYCTRPACVLAQRDRLAAMLTRGHLRDEMVSQGRGSCGMDQALLGAFFDGWISAERAHGVTHENAV